MDSALVEIFRYDLSLAKPLPLAGQILTRRSGFILTFGLDQAKGYGDIAPLPGFSPETLEQALDAAKTWAGLLGRLPKTAPERDAALEFLRTTPSLAFAIDCATFGMRHAIGSTRALGLFGTRRGLVAVNALLMGARDEALAQAQAAKDAGFRAAKLKVGRRSVQEDADLVREVRQVVGNAIALRLDANRAWDLDAALEFAQRVADCEIEYIEEPVSTPGDLVEFARRGGMPVALDESLLELTNLKDRLWAKAIVLKPTLLGGIARCERLAFEALEFGIKPVVSACFESGVGIIALARFAATLTTEDIPAGLDTYDWLADDVLEKRFRIRNGALDLDELDACAKTLNTEALEKVYSG